MPSWPTYKWTTDEIKGSATQNTPLLNQGGVFLLRAGFGCLKGQLVDRRAKKIADLRAQQGENYKHNNCYQYKNQPILHQSLPLFGSQEQHVEPPFCAALTRQGYAYRTDSIHPLSGCDNSPLGLGPGSEGGHRIDVE